MSSGSQRRGGKMAGARACAVSGGLVIYGGAAGHGQGRGLLGGLGQGCR